MYRIAPSNQFKKDLKLCDKRNLPREEISLVVEELQKGNPLAPKYRDHQLSGNRNGQRDCHIRPDWVLIYKIDKEKTFLSFFALAPTLTFFN